MSEPTVQPRKRLKGRSPAYPAISLDLAIERAQVIYQREHRHPAPISVIQNHWGMKSGTGTSNVAVAALKRFGLLEDEGLGEARTGRLTDLAVDILLSQSEDPGRHLQLIRQAAMLPSIHRELWEKYGGSLPSDATLRRELVLVRNFTESGAQEFIGQFRKTLAFARMNDGAVAPSSGQPTEPETLAEDHDKREEGSFPMQSHVASYPPPVVSQPTSAATPDPSMMSPPALADTVTIPILLPGVPPVHITGRFPITEAAWTQLMAVLQAMKGGMVAE